MKITIYEIETLYLLSMNRLQHEIFVQLSDAKQIAKRIAERTVVQQAALSKKKQDFLKEVRESYAQRKAST
ncbi:MAG: hypothetical protein ACR2KZ_06580 [Segetibacter sp.]